MSLKATGLRLAAGQVSSQPVVTDSRISQMRLRRDGGGTVEPEPGEPNPARLACSGEDWTRLEGALGGLAALEAIDLSDNGALGTSGVGRLVSSCAGELIACVIWFCAFSCLCVTLVCRELATCAVWRQREGCAPECD